MKAKNYRRVKLIWVQMALCIAAFCGAFIYLGDFSAAASPGANKEIPNLQGQEAIEHLQNQGVYQSLQEAIKSVRREDALVDPQIKITADDGAAEDIFGSDVAVSGNTVVIGSRWDTIGTNDFQGSVYVFVRQASGWVQQQKLVADPPAEEIFGSSVAIEGNTIVVGAPSARPNGIGYRGAGYVFTRNGENWTQQQRLISDNGGSEDLGKVVAISGDTIVLGTDRGQTVDGRALVFVRSGGVWQEQQVLTASDTAAGNLFGRSVGISGDTIIVGAAFAVINGDIRRGAGYVFVRSGANWIEQQKLTAPDGQMHDQFGISTTISGETLAIGAPVDENAANQNRGVYIFTRNGSVWTLEQKLSPHDGKVEDGFGRAVALDGDSILVGASNQNLGTNRDQGAVYQFVRVGTNWSQQRKLIASDGAEDDLFGASVALDDGISVVASRADIGANIDQGAAYIFECGRTEQGQLLANDGAAFDQFGSAVAISGDTVVVGAALEEDAGGATQGAAYVFVRGGSGWIQQQKLKADPPLNNAEFGNSVDISGNTIVVGAWRETVGTNDTQGAAYVFVRNGSTWTQQARLLAVDGTFQDQFGGAVAIDGDTIVVGAHSDDVGANANQGAVYVFTRSGSTWTQQTRFSSSNGAANDNFGSAVDISGETVAVGAFRKNSFRGAAYIFTRSGAAWTEQQSLTAADGESNDEFGFAVALDGSTLAVGAHKDDTDQFQDHGSVYIFTRNGSVWSQQAKIIHDSQLQFAQTGYALALEGGNLLIGQGGGLNTVWLYERNRTIWSLNEEFSGAALSDFGEAVGMSGVTIVIGALAKTVGGNSQQGDATVYYGDCSTAPVGTGAGAINRRRCKAPAQAILGTVSDGQEPAGSLTVTTQTVPAGITLTNLTNTNGTVTAQVGAECTAAIGANTVVLRVRDAAFGISTFNVAVNVIDKQNTADFDGDRKTDISIFRPSNGQWWYQKSSDNGVNAFIFGSANDKLMPADFDGDGKTDAAFWRPSTGEWFVLRSSNATFFSAPFGLPADKPQRGDFDGDGRADFAVFRPSNGVWYILRSMDNSVSFQQFGTSNDTPVPADYDDDGTDDIAIFRPSTGTWWISRSTAGLFAVNFGVGTDRTVQGDYTGDGLADVAVFRPSSGVWYVLRSEDLSFFAAPFGNSTDIPAPGDYDGDGKFDFAVFRPSETNWYIQKSGGGTVIQAFGLSSDTPVPAASVAP